MGALLALSLNPLFAQAPSAILVDGSGPWQNSQWSFTVSQFSGLLNDAGYSVTVVSPANLPAALSNTNVMLAVPSLASLPFDTLTAIANFATSGGSLMASGGQPFSDPLYLAPNGQWLDANAYQQAVGTAPPQGAFTPPQIPTVSPAKEQFTNTLGLRVPVVSNRGINPSAGTFAPGRYRAIGDLFAPAATLYTYIAYNFQSLTSTSSKSLVVWLPWPQIFDPLRAQLVSALAAAPANLYIQNAGAEQAVWLPGEAITGMANVVSTGTSPVQATLQWSVSGPSGTTPQPSIPLLLAARGSSSVPLNIGSLPVGEYTLSFHLTIGNQEVDSLDSPVRVLDPLLSRQPDQKIRVVDGSFSAGGHHVFLNGVNYWPRYVASQNIADFNGQSWLEAGQYDPAVVEADLTEIAALGFNLVSIQFTDYLQGWAQEGRSLMDFLERCRAHDIWARIDLGATAVNGAFAGQLSPTLDNYLQAAYLPGNDRVFAYEILWEPIIGTYNTGGAGMLVNGVLLGVNAGRTLLDPAWASWVNDQYGSLTNAQQAWGMAPPLNSSGQLTNPSDDQIANDGPWRIMVAAYRRFLEDYLGRNIGVVARDIRRTDPDTLITYRDWTTMTSTHNSNTGYDIGTGAAHLDFVSPERYYPALPWPDDRAYGLVTAYSRYRSGGKPVHWAEFGADVGANGGTAASQASQAAVCDTMMRQVADEGSNGASVWWWPGGAAPLDGSDFGIIDPDGTPRGCALNLSQWNTTFAAAAPDLTSNPSTTITVDRDADARGSYGLFLNYQNSYVQARQSGMSVVLADQGTGTDTSTMPLTQVGNAPYAGSGPLKFANAEFAGIRVLCPSLDVTVENGSSVAVPPGAACQLTPTMVNTGEAQWLPGSAASKGVVLHTNAGDIALAASLPSLQRTAMGPLAITMGQSAMTVTGRMTVAGVGSFGEVLNLTLTVDSSSTGACPFSFSPAAAIAVPSTGTSGTINVTTAAGCFWQASSSQTWVTLNAPGGTGSGPLGYTIPSNYGPTRQATITVAGHPFTVTEAGISTAAQAPAPTLSAASLTFGSQTVGAPSGAQSVKLSNPGTAVVNLGAVAIGGLNNGDFSETDNCGAALAAGASCTIQVVFTPTAPGTRTSAVFVSGSIAGGPLAVSLSGSGAGTGPVPAIQAVVDSWGYLAGIAPGLWVTIGGTNLGGAPQTWDVTGQQLPLTLGDVTVTFNGAPAAMMYVSGTQINALVPASVAPGPVQVVVQVDGVDSSPLTMTAKATQPAVYAPPTADGSTFFVTAVLPGTATLIGNSATDPRVLRPAYPGDTLDLYMIGLGATLDPSAFVTDQVFQGAFPVSAAVTATVGGEAANVLFAGLTSPGLYLVRIVVPTDLAAGAQPLVVSAGGIQTRPSLVLQMGVAPPN